MLGAGGDFWSVGEGAAEAEVEVERETVSGGEREPKVSKSGRAKKAAHSQAAHTFYWLPIHLIGKIELPKCKIEVPPSSQLVAKTEEVPF